MNVHIISGVLIITALLIAIVFWSWSRRPEYCRSSIGPREVRVLITEENNKYAVKCHFVVVLCC